MIGSEMHYLKHLLKKISNNPGAQSKPVKLLNHLSNPKLLKLGVARRPVFNRTVLLFGSPFLQFSVLFNRTQNVLLLILCVLLLLFCARNSLHFHLAYGKTRNLPGTLPLEPRWGALEHTPRPPAVKAHISGDCRRRRSPQMLARTAGAKFKLWMYVFFCYMHCYRK